MRLGSAGSARIFVSGREPSVATPRPALARRLGRRASGRLERVARGAIMALRIAVPGNQG